MDVKLLLDQFLGEGASTPGTDTNRAAKRGAAGGLAVGGMLGLMMGSKKVRKKARKAAKYGGAAALGALAYRAYQNYQTDQSAPHIPEDRFLPSAAPSADGQPFELALVLAMISAANADGHIGPDEQRVIFERVGESDLEALEKGFVFDALSDPPGLNDVAALATGVEQATELYMVSRMAIDVDHPAEVAYLEALAARLQLPRELVNQIDQEVG
ncbi:MAG: tellurite resistance TerB family protein [Rhodothermales bacterium]|nr:tellurite resistance TerB family protein [Rhodothermales bacterium]MBO6778649.1 tellurite resistance TerB family protein [Rhodothermales bacterium]